MIDPRIRSSLHSFCNLPGIHQTLPPSTLQCIVYSSTAARYACAQAYARNLCAPPAESDRVNNHERCAEIAAAPNVSAIPLRQEKFATVGPSRVKPQDAVGEVAKDEQGVKEEIQPFSWSSIVKGTHAMEGGKWHQIPRACTSDILTPYAINEKIENDRYVGSARCSWIDFRYSTYAIAYIGCSLEFYVLC